MTIGKKFALWIAVILIALSAVTAYVFYSIELREETAKLDVFGRMSGGIVEESLITFMQKRDAAGLNKKLDDVAAGAGAINGILLLNRDGVVKAATDKGLINRKFSVFDAGCRECHEKGSKGLLALGGNIYRWASPIENKSACHACHLPSVENNGVLIIDFSVAEFKHHVREELMKGFFIFGSSIALMGAIMIVLSRTLITRRLERTGAAMRNFRQGIQPALAPVEGRDEITRLETGFNEMARTITAREREKDELVRRVNEQVRFHQLLIDTIPMPVFYKDANGVYLGCNRTFLEYIGLTKDNIAGKTVYDVAPKEFAEKYDRMDRELFDRPGIQKYEYAVKHADGTVREVIVNKATYTDGAGTVAGLIGVMTDITERKRSEEMLELLKKSIDVSPDAAFWFDSTGRFIYANDSACQSVGYDRDELLKMHLGDINPDANKESWPDLWEQLRAQKTIYAETMHRHKDGLLFPVEILSTYVTFGEREYICGFARNITAQKTMEMALKESEERYRTLAEAAHDAIFIVNRQGLMEYINQYAAGQLQRRPEEIIGKPRAELFPREIADQQEISIQKVFRSGEPVYSEERISLAGREAWLSTRLVPFRKASGEVDAVLGIARDITERKRLEQKLAQSEEHLRAIIDTEPECVKIIALDGTLLEMNPAGLAMIEADSIDDVSGQQIISLVAPEHRAAFEALSRKTFRGESGMLEFEVIGLKGTRRWLETHSAPLRNARGKIFALLGVTRDITERKRAEQVIRRNYDAQTAINWVLHISLEDIPLESVLKQTLDLILSIPWLSIESKGGIFLVEDDPHKLVMKAQRGLSDFVKEECEVVPFGKCLCGRAAARGEVQFADAVDERHEVHQEGMPSHGHYCIPVMHGKTVLGVINMYLKEGHVRDEKEIEFLNAMASALAGVIQRKRIEDEREKLIADLRRVLGTLSRSHREWQDTFDSITDMISIVDRDFTILKANKAFSAYYGLEPPAVIGRKCHEIVHDGGSPAPNCPHTMTVYEAGPSSEEFYDKKTKKMFRIFTFPYNAPEGGIIGSIHIMRDITDDKEKEVRLIMSERLAALGQMASGIAHEINNPLASIAGCSEGLLTRVKKGQCDTPLFESYLNIIQEEVFRCKSITTAMLSFVRKTTYEKKDINLAESLNKTIEIIGFQGRLKSIEVVKKYQEPMPMVHGNEGELRQVLLVVITNALDAMQDKGTLTIEAEAGDGGSVIRISDTGAGISPEIINKIFDPFFTTKSDRGGTGLGLSIARKIVANHNGRIEASSNPGQGTTFTITLPQ